MRLRNRDVNEYIYNEIFEGLVKGYKVIPFRKGITTEKGTPAARNALRHLVGPTGKGWEIYRWQGYVIGVGIYDEAADLLFSDTVREAVEKRREVFEEMPGVMEAAKRYLSKGWGKWVGMF